MTTTQIEGTPAIGQVAPDFTLRDQHGRSFTLSELRGDRHVALVFYPYAFSGVCTGEWCEVRDNIGIFEAADVQVVGVSCDPIWTLRAFSEAEGYAFPLLSDFWPHGAVAQKYGVFDQAKGMALRGTFLIDASGALRWSVVNGPGEARSLAAYQEAIAQL